MPTLEVSTIRALTKESYRSEPDVYIAQVPMSVDSAGTRIFAKDDGVNEFGEGTFVAMATRMAGGVRFDNSELTGLGGACYQLSAQTGTVTKGATALLRRPTPHRP